MPGGERACKCFGEDRAVVYAVDHECVDHELGKLVIQVEKREILGCRKSEGDGKESL